MSTTYTVANRTASSILIGTLPLAPGASVSGVPLTTDEFLRLTSVSGVTVTADNVVASASASFTRPADTTAYASGDLVANSVTAGSVVALSLGLSQFLPAGGKIRRVTLRKDGTGVTNAAFRVHFYKTAAPTPANGDNGAWSTSGVANYLGSADVTIDKAFTDGAYGTVALAEGQEINFTVGTVYALIEARGVYTPASAEVTTLLVEAEGQS